MDAPSAPLALFSFPRAILHVDGDAFFTSVEQALHPEWRGRPMVTGKERGIIACASYEAKALGIARGIRLHEAIRMCPELVVLPSDYETYSLFSKRMFDVMRRHTPMVEESSIDEGFADLTGLRRLYRTSYEEIARRIRADVQATLGITVSAGLAPSKVVAKMASKFRKPDGFTAVAGHHLHLFLGRRRLEDVWGFGPNTVALLRKQGLATPLDYVNRPVRWAEDLLGKIGRELWHELRGESLYAVSTEEKSDYATISKCKTFTAPSSDRDYVHARLLRNIESACIKLRRHRLRARRMTVALRRRDYEMDLLEARLTRATSATQELAPLAGELFARLFAAGAEYRSTVVVFADLEADGPEQMELFEDRPRIERLRRAAEAIDTVNERFGKHKVTLGTGLFMHDRPSNARDEQPWRKKQLLPGETKRCRIALPRLRIRV